MVTLKSIAARVSAFVSPGSESPPSGQTGPAKAAARRVPLPPLAAFLPAVCDRAPGLRVSLAALWTAAGAWYNTNRPADTPPDFMDLRHIVGRQAPEVRFRRNRAGQYFDGLGLRGSASFTPAPPLTGPRPLMFSDFLAERCDQAKGLRVTASELFEEYQDWRAKVNPDDGDPTEHSMRELVTYYTRGVRSRRSGGEELRFEGLGLRSAAIPAAPAPQSPQPQPEI
jgi:hypothetical protein